MCNYDMVEDVLLDISFYEKDLEKAKTKEEEEELKLKIKAAEELYKKLHD